MLWVRSRHHGKVLRLRGVRRKKTHEALDGKIQALAIRVTVAVQEYDGILGNIDLRTKCGPIGKRTEDLGIRCMLKNSNLCFGIPIKLTLVDLGPLGCESLHRLAGLINSIEKRLGNSQIHLVKIRPDLVVGLFWILLDCIQKLLNNERVILENHKLRVDGVNLLGKLVEAKPLLARFLSGRCVLRNHSIGNLAMVRSTWMTLKSKMKDLDLRGQRSHLAQKIVCNLGLSGRLIDVRTHEKNAH